MTARKRVQHKFSTRRRQAQYRKAQRKARIKVARFNKELSGEGGIRTRGTVLRSVRRFSPKRCFRPLQPPLQA